MICSMVAEIWEHSFIDQPISKHLILKFMFLNLPHYDGLKMLNTAEPQYHFYIGG